VARGSVVLNDALTKLAEAEPEFVTGSAQSIVSPASASGQASGYSKRLVNRRFRKH